MFCSSCGASVPSDAAFCTKCGASLYSGAAKSDGALSDNPYENTSRLQSGDFGNYSNVGEPVVRTAWGHFCYCMKYRSWKGRARRAEYWSFAIFSAIITYVGLGVLCVAAAFLRDSARDSLLIPSLFVIYGVGCFGAFFLAGLAVFIRRLHDANLSGWFFWLACLPYVGGIVGLVFGLLPGTPNANNYGPDPRFQEAIDDFAYDDGFVRPTK